MSRKWKVSEKQFLKDNYSKMKVTDISKEINRSGISIYQTAHVLGLEKKPKIDLVRFVSIHYKGETIDSVELSGKEKFIDLMERNYFNIRPALLRGEQVVVQMTY